MDGIEFWGKSAISRGYEGIFILKATVVSVFGILVFQFFANIKSWWSSSLPENSVRYASSTTTTTTTTTTSSNFNIHPKLTSSQIILTLDLKSLIDDLDDTNQNNDNGQIWDIVTDRSTRLMAYRVQSCKPKDGPLKYLSVTTFENCSAEKLRDFYMDNDYRKKWDKTFVDHEQLQVDESNSTEIGRMIKKFPLLTAREYVLAWRVWESKSGSFYCLSKECEHPMAPRQKKYVRVKFFRSGWCIRQVPGRNASEIRMVHQEDAGLNVEMAKLAFSKGIWSYVLKMDNALRNYLDSYIPQSSLGVTAVTLMQKVPAELDIVPDVSVLTDVERFASSTPMRQNSSKDDQNCSSTKRTSKVIAKGLIVLGGVICISRGHSSLGAKVALAYIFTKLSKRSNPSNLPSEPK